MQKSIAWEVMHGRNGQLHEATHQTENTMNTTEIRDLYEAGSISIQEAIARLAEML